MSFFSNIFEEGFISIIFSGLSVSPFVLMYCPAFMQASLSNLTEMKCIIYFCISWPTWHTVGDPNKVICRIEM